MGKIGYLILLVICLIAIFFGFMYWTEPVSENLPSVPEAPDIKPDYDQQEDFEKAQSLVRAGKPKMAIKVIDRYKEEIETQTEWGDRWLDLLVQASSEIPDISQLVILYRYRPEAFSRNEKASLMVAEALLFTGRDEEFISIRRMWKGREMQKSEWLMVDADRLSFDGEWREAIKLLEAHEFPPQQDVSRLIRLALLNMADNPQDAWVYLSRANEIDPNNAVILSHRAMLLEAVGQESDALSEYLAATAVDPDNMAMKEQLTDFYIRNNQYSQVIEVLEEVLNNPTAADTLWLKALFWGRVIKPIEIDWKSVSPPNGKYLPVVQYFLTLKPWEFWNQEAFDKIPDHEKFLHSLQPLWWLRLLSAVKQENDAKAVELLENIDFEEPLWNPELAEGFRRILNYRKNGTLAIENTSFGGETKEIEELSFFSQLERYAQEGSAKIPEELNHLLKSQLAFTAALLASGWNEAAIDMQSVKVFPSDIPSWVVFSYTQALRENRGDHAAMEFVKLQYKSPSLDLLAAEMMLEEGNVDSAEAHLKALSQEDGNVGMRASWLLSTILLDGGDYDAAKEVVTKNPTLANSTLGKEALARIALQEGDDEEAERLYRDIEEESAEAKSFFARKAFAEGDWQRARELTIELLKAHPNNAVLQQNLLKIQEAQKQ